MNNTLNDLLATAAADYRARGDQATAARFDAYLAGQESEHASLDERLKAAGMFTVAEALKGLPLDHFIKHAAVCDMVTFAQWLEMKRAECLRLHASFELGDRKDGELHEWALAQMAVLGEVHVNFKAAVAGQPVLDLGSPQVVGALLLGGVDGGELGDIDLQVDSRVAEAIQAEMVKGADDVTLDVMTVAEHSRRYNKLALLFGAVLARVHELERRLGPRVEASPAPEQGTPCDCIGCEAERLELQRAADASCAVPSVLAAVDPAELAAYRVTGSHPVAGQTHHALYLYQANADDEAASWRSRGVDVAMDELTPLAKRNEDVALLQKRIGSLDRLAIANKALADSYQAESQALQQKLETVTARVAELEQEMGREQEGRDLAVALDAVAYRIRRELAGREIGAAALQRMFFLDHSKAASLLEALKRTGKLAGVDEKPYLAAVPGQVVNDSAHGAEGAAEVVRLVDLLGAVAGAAFRAVGNGWELFDDYGKPCRAMTILDYKDLHESLEDCEFEAEIKDGKDRDGWEAVLETLRLLVTPAPAQAAPAQPAV